MTKAIIKTLLSKLLNTPLVIEEGTSGIWAYRKWSDGTAECFGNRNLGSKSITTAYGSNSYYAAGDTIPFPTGLFTSVLSVCAQSSDGGGYGTWFNVSSVSTTAVTGYMFSTYSSARTIVLHLYIVGKWK